MPVSSTLKPLSSVKHLNNKSRPIIFGAAFFEYSPWSLPKQAWEQSRHQDDCNSQRAKPRQQEPPDRKGSLRKARGPFQQLPVRPPPYEQRCQKRAEWQHDFACEAIDSIENIGFGKN